MFYNKNFKKNSFNPVQNSRHTGEFHWLNLHRSWNPSCKEVWEMQFLVSQLLIRRHRKRLEWILGEDVDIIATP